MNGWRTFAIPPRRRVHRPRTDAPLGFLDGGARSGWTPAQTRPTFSRLVRDEVRRQRTLSFPPRLPWESAPTTDERIRRRITDLELRPASERVLIVPRHVVEGLGGRRIESDETEEED
jgi:hypothetical protein